MSSPCAEYVYEKDRFTVCAYDPSKHRVKIALRSASGDVYRSFANLSNDFTPRSVAFAMNAGMYDHAGYPIGLLVEDGREAHGLNTAAGVGNFFMSPNGVFWVDRAGAAHVSTTSNFQAMREPELAMASQSGPMLVISGALHPALSHDGASKYIRNGVGVICGEQTLFAISAQPVSFGKLARLFRDELQCQDALYFDGAVSSLWAPALNRMDAHAPLGPLVVVEIR